MKITTWNINSLRLRLPLLEEVVAKINPEVIALQEIKVEDKLFPLDAVKALGYEHVAFKGQKSYNGVALLSKLPLENVEMINMCGQEDCRHIAATVNGVRLHNFYIPAGGDIPDVDENPKFKHKLDFVTELTAMNDTHFNKVPSIIVGDFNIAPLEHDVWGSKQLRKIVSHTDIEREMLMKAINEGNWIDVARHFHQPHEKVYTWWSYRSSDWQKANKGRRLDHIWASASLIEKLKSFAILSEVRGATQPSDHVPVTIEVK